MPYVQFESVGDFIPNPRCSKFVVGLQTEGRKMGVQEVRSDSGQRGRERRELRYVLCVRACARGLNLMVLLLCTSELDRPESTYLLEESASPFIDEGMALQAMFS